MTRLALITQADDLGGREIYDAVQQIVGSDGDRPRPPARSGMMRLGGPKPPGDGGGGRSILQILKEEDAQRVRNEPSLKSRDSTWRELLLDAAKRLGSVEFDDVFLAAAKAAEKSGLAKALGVNPLELRIYNKIVGSDRDGPLTEREFSEGELRDLGRLIGRKVSKTGSEDGDIRWYPSDDGDDYGDDGSGWMGVLGQFMFRKHPDGYFVVHDTYDFDKEWQVVDNDAAPLHERVAVALSSPSRYAEVVGFKRRADGWYDRGKPPSGVTVEIRVPAAYVTGKKRKS